MLFKKFNCLILIKRSADEIALNFITSVGGQVLQLTLMLHALRQTGKTTCLLALREYLNTGNHSGSGKVRGIW